MTGWADIINSWPETGTRSRTGNFAADIGVTALTARAWKRRGIPAEYWTLVVARAAARNIPDIDYQRLARLAAATGKRRALIDRQPEPAGVTL